MARIGILTCSNATQDLGCSSSSCLSALRKRSGAFLAYPDDEKLDLIGIINCPGCPTLTGPEKLIERIRGLTEFRVDVIHFTYCIKTLCPFKAKYKKAIEASFPNIKIVIGTHAARISDAEYRERIKKLFAQNRKTMVDVILNKD